MKNLEKLDKEINEEIFLKNNQNFENENFLNEQIFFGEENLKMDLKGYSKGKDGMNNFKIIKNEDIFLYRFNEINLDNNFDNKKIKEFQDLYSRKMNETVITNKKELDFIKVDKKNIKTEENFFDLKNKKILKENIFIKNFEEKNLDNLNEDFFDLWNKIINKDEKCILKSKCINK